MRYHYDLHIHSVLSPCADVLMTPNNIFNMAMLKQLNIISITDHNSLKQLPISVEIAESYSMLYIPGVEVTVKEGFDVLIYFKFVIDAMAFDKILEKYIKEIKIDLEKYNEQVICDINDSPDDIFPFLLTQPLTLSFEKLLSYVKPYEHLMFYAHVDRYFEKVRPWIKKYPCNGVEYKLKKLMPDLINIHNSDAHQIIDILESEEENSVELKTLSIEDFFEYFQHG